MEHRPELPDARLHRLDCGPDRCLEVLTALPADRMPLVFHNGTPSAAVVYPPLLRAADAAGLSFVTWSRPGYGTSTEQPGRSVADAIADTVAVLDSIGAESFVTLGWSGGGPYALACATQLPERCRAAATLAGMAPYGVEGLDWLAGMGPENVAGFSAAVAGEGPLVTFLETVAPVMSRVSAGDVAEVLGGIISDVDRAALTGEFAEFMSDMIRRSLSAGIAGWKDDILASLRDWHFDYEANATPVFVWHGEEDRMVPYEHGRWLCDNIPGAIARLLPGQGHLSLAVTRIGEILQELATLSGSGDRGLQR